MRDSIAPDFVRGDSEVGGARPVVARAVSSGTTTINPGWTKINLAGTPIYDRLGIVDTTNSQIIIPESGYYMVWAYSHDGGAAPASGTRWLQVIAAGGQSLADNRWGAESGGTQQNIVGIRYYDFGTKLHIEAYQTSGVNHAYDGSLSVFKLSDNV